ncbi:MAG: hypothetical protein ACOYLB_08975 [Phototrophicaceae bacterium]
MNPLKIKRVYLWLLLVLSLATTAQGQDGLNLPSELYILLNEGYVERYGLGTEGIQQATPDGQFVIDFGVSADGQWLAYRTSEFVIVIDPLSGAGSVIDFEPSFPLLRGQGKTLAWAPNGKAIAYTTSNGLRVTLRGESGQQHYNVSDSLQGFAHLLWSPLGDYLVATTNNGIWQIYHITAQGIRLAAATPNVLDVAWVDAHQLAFTPAEGGVMMLDLDRANTQHTLFSSQQRFDLLYPLEGQLLQAFRVEGDSGTLVEIDYGRGQITQRGEQAITLEGLQWGVGGKQMVAWRGGALALLDPRTQQGLTLPIANAVMFDWGIPPLSTAPSFNLPSNGYFLADDATGITQVWLLPKDNRPPVMLTQATESVRGYGVSTGQTAVVYSSGRALWRVDFDNPATPLRLTDLAEDGDVMPTFNQDGTLIAYSDENGVWLIPSNGGESRLLAPSVYDDDPALIRVLFSPRFAPNVGALLVNVMYAEGISTGVVDLTSGELQELPFGYINGRWLNDHSILTFTDATDNGMVTAGLQRTPVNDLVNSLMVLPPQVAVMDALLLDESTYRLILRDAQTFETTSPLSVVDYRAPAGLIPIYTGSHLKDAQLAPDGSMMAGYARVQPSQDGYRHGQLAFVDFTTGEQLGLILPTSVWQFRWYP